MQFDYLIVGAGLCGCTIAEQLWNAGKNVVILERRKVVGGNLYCEDVEGIKVHKYGAHIFRTSDKQVWDYVNRFAEFNRFTNSPIANYKGELYNLPFNMNTFHQLFGVKTPEEAMKAIKDDCVYTENPKNLEEHVLSLVGKTIYEKLIKEYTEKQWGRSCKELPPSVIKRIPVRYTFDNNYFNEKWQGIPIDGYDSMIKRMIDGIPKMVKCDFNTQREEYKKLAKKVIYTGAIDELYDFVFGSLKWRTLRFEHRLMAENNIQGVAVMNYTSHDVPYTRTIEHKHFTFGDDLPHTVITEEYPCEWEQGMEPYYPINDDKNQKLYERYHEKAVKDGYLLCGRLAEYKYYDMQDTIKSALKLSKQLLEE